MSMFRQFDASHQKPTAHCLKFCRRINYTQLFVDNGVTGLFHKYINPKITLHRPRSGCALAAGAHRSNCRVRSAFQKLLRGEYTPSLFLTEAAFKLHRADRVGQEVRHRNGTEKPVNIQNKTQKNGVRSEDGGGMSKWKHAFSVKVFHLLDALAHHKDTEQSGYSNMN